MARFVFIFFLAGSVAIGLHAQQQSTGGYPDQTQYPNPGAQNQNSVDCSDPMEIGAPECSGFALTRTLSGKTEDAAYEFINWFLSGWAGAYLSRQGYYSAVLATTKKFLAPYEWSCRYDGQPATQDIHAPDGTLIEKVGAVRDGGSYETRMSRIACWNSVMDENEYLITKWNQFIAA